MEIYKQGGEIDFADMTLHLSSTYQNMQNKAENGYFASKTGLRRLRIKLLEIKK